MQYILNEKEVQAKTELWMKQNEEYLKEQKGKRADRLAFNALINTHLVLAVQMAIKPGSVKPRKGECLELKIDLNEVRKFVGKVS